MRLVAIKNIINYYLFKILTIFLRIIYYARIVYLKCFYSNQTKKDMRKQLILALTVGGLLVTGCTKDTLEDAADYTSENLLLEEQSDKLLSIKEINAYIDQSFYKNESFDWADAPANVLWSATVHGRNILTIGYGEKGDSYRTPGDKRLENEKEQILNIVANTSNKSRKDLRVLEDETLNLVDVEVTDLSTIRELRATPNVRYLEPNGYSFYELKPKDGPVQQRSSSGCGMGAQNIQSADYRTVSPNAKFSWTYDYHNIEQAWSKSTGAGVTVGVIDTGISNSQPLLSSKFDDAVSINSRTVQKYGTFIDSPWWWSNNYDGPNDKCGHGTSMISTIAAPRNDENRAVGVAYNCNIVSYRGTEDVLLNDYHERKGVSNALKALGNRNDVKIISMSIGYPWSIGNVRDAVKYANYKGKLIFAAGGTSLDFTNWYPVIFPANMSQTVAVTGITDASGYNQCDTCHDGSQIEFTIVMERDTNNSRTGVTLGFYNGQDDYVGGSSVATATTAGIAALVWAKYPNWSKDQVLNRMRQSSALYPNKDNNYGYGNIDANQAVQ